MITKQKTPKVRFKGFSEDWVEKNLADEVAFFSGLTYKPSNVINKAGTLVLRSSNVQGGALTLGDNVYVTSAVVNSQNVKTGDIIVVVRNGSRNLIGKHAMITRPMTNTVIGAFMTGIRAKNPSFFNALLDTQEFEDEVSKNLGATINQITGGMFKKMEFYIPQSKEQAAIGNIFQNIDKTIALQRRKYHQTQTLKRSLLGKMFPQANQSQPDIRLKSFSDPWVEYRLGDIANFINGRAYKQDELLDSGKYPVLRVGNFNTNTHWYYSDLELDDKFYVNQGDLLYTWATIFAPYLWSGNKAIYHYHIWKLDLTCSLDKLFTFHLLKAEEVSLTSNTNGSTMIHVTKGEMENKKLKIPSIEEQKAIGKLLKQLDDTLTLQTKQLKTLENLKKALLAKMFV